jgi:VMA21-like domain
VGKKLGLATGFMFTLPIAAYYLARYVFSDRTNPDTYAGGAAILVTNIIVGVYCYQAYIEDSEEKSTIKDEDGPKVGIYKERVD